MASLHDCENCRSYDLKAQVRALNDLIRIAQESVSSLELDSLLQTILRGAADFMEMPVGRLALYDKRNGKMVLRAHIGLENCTVLCNVWTVEPGTLTGQLLRRNEIHCVEDFDQIKDELGDYVAHDAVRSLICIPLVTKRSIHGMLHLYDHIPRVFDKNRISQISVLASFAAISIENAKFHDETHRMAINDALTGLNNRRYFDKVLPQEYERAHRDGLPFSLIMIDVDNFKRFNDTHGHHLGDRILAAIGRVLRRTLRSIDFAFRYGGEEFVVILPETDLDSAHKVAERIRVRVITESRKLLRNQEDPPVTVSMGISSYPRDAACSITLLAMADQLLYQAKKAGRNRVLVSEVGVS
ncbi:MAG: GGDEF domain-containing protein [Desulfuromonadales bacterium]|nr:GGDEF domain-containing protein [Desulfuromonadales bacterium]